MGRSQSLVTDYVKAPNIEGHQEKNGTLSLGTICVDGDAHVAATLLHRLSSSL